MSDLLFPDSETFTKERPTEMTSKQSDELYLKLAKEVINEGWSNSDPKDIAESIKEIPYYLNNGYERAKYLEDHCFWTGIEVSFVEWLDSLDDQINDVIKENVKAWVQAHNIQPQFKKGDTLNVQNNFSGYITGDIIHVTNIYPDEARYTVDVDPNRRGGYLIAFEKVEANCKLL